MRKLLFLYFFILGVALKAQILDDSTVLVYGPSTVNVILEDHLKSNNDSLIYIDTSLYKLDNWDRYDQLDRMYQNLGNLGTAMFPTFYQQPNTLGKQVGYTAFDQFAQRPDQVKYYDTKSPFIEMLIVFGGQGRSSADFNYSQNINPNWNFGVQFARSTGDKQIGVETNEDRNAVSTKLNFFTYYTHPKKPYKLMFNVTSLDHKMDETGGIYLDQPDSLLQEEDLFQYQNNPVWLQDARIDDRRFNWHLYHEYGLFKQFQLYHQFDRGKQTNTYRDFSESNSFGGDYSEYYPNYFIDLDSTYQRSTFTSMSNEAGLKGTISSVFYRFYVRNRIINHDFLYLEPMDRAIENYIGGHVQLSVGKLFRLDGKAELMQTGEFWFSGLLSSQLLDVEYSSRHYQQSILSQRYFGNHFDWSNEFDNGFTNNLKGRIKVNWKGISIRPEVDLMSLSNYVYFDESQQPAITSDVTLMGRFGGELDFFLPTNREHQEGFRLDNQLFYTVKSGNDSDFMRIPTFFYNARLYWDGSWFKRTVPVQIGADIHHRSAYYANSYSPATQQFYVQDERQIFDGHNLPISLFWNMRIEKIFVFVKWTHVNQPGDGGYFITPLYPGQQRAFDFGVKWLFFD